MAPSGRDVTLFLKDAKAFFVYLIMKYDSAKKQITARTEVITVNVFLSLFIVFLSEHFVYDGNYIMRAMAEIFKPSHHIIFPLAFIFFGIF